MLQLFNRIITRRVPSAEKIKSDGAARGQGMTEFALVLPLLLLLVFGVIELGRLMVIYSSVSAASREAGRYAAAAGRATAGVPFYLDKAGMAAAAQRFGVLSAITVNVNTDITYDHGPGTSLFTPTSSNDVRLGDRVSITVHSDYDPLLGLTPLQPFEITSTTSRTILKEVAIGTGSSGGGGGGGGGGPPSVSITAPDTDGEFSANQGENIPFVCTGSDPDGQAVTITWWEGGDNLANGDSFDTASLSPGNHVITCRGEDPGGNQATDSITVIINAPPWVVIDSPNSGMSYEEGVELTFTGRAEDLEDGVLSDTIIWFDNGVQFGTGASFTYSALVVGFHVITAQVTDSNNVTATSAPITFAIILRSPPTLIITTPADDSYYAVDTVVVFQGTANDAKDGDLSSSIRWSSDLDGNMGTGAGISTDGLRIGTHTVTAEVTDSDGLTTTDTVTIRIVDDSPPVVSITSPENGRHYNLGTDLLFTATAVDDTDGDLSEDLEWFSSVDGGPFGSGGSFSYSQLTAGNHTITARVTDSDGLTGTRSIIIYIDSVNTAPVVTIVTPNDGSGFRETNPVNFSGTAIDIQDGDISSLLRWTSDVMGSIGSGSSITVTNLSPGTHLITASVTDFGGLSASDDLTVNIRPMICPSAGSPVQHNKNNNFVDYITWDITIPSGDTQLDQFLMMELRIDLLLNPSNAQVSDIEVEGVSKTFTRVGNDYTVTADPVWGPAFFPEPSRRIRIVFTFNPEVRRNRGSQFYMYATFEGCQDRLLTGEILP